MEEKSLTVAQESYVAEIGELKRRAVSHKRLMKFVETQLIESKDFGPAYEGSDKWNIYKAGCESVREAFALVDRPFLDPDAWEMAGKPNHVIFMRIYLIPAKLMPQVMKGILLFGAPNEELVYRLMAVSIGVGAADIKEGQVGTWNTADKKAKIRAFKDAILNLGLSDYFTQDWGNEENENGISEPKATTKQKKGRSKDLGKVSNEEMVKQIAEWCGEYNLKGEIWNENATRLAKLNNRPALESLYRSVETRTKQTGGKHV